MLVAIDDDNVDWEQAYHLRACYCDSVVDLRSQLARALFVGALLFEHC
jgi:hypothetical protein